MFRDIKNFLVFSLFQRGYMTIRIFQNENHSTRWTTRPRFLLSRPRWLFRKSNDRYWQRDIPDPFLRPKWNVINVDAEFAILKERTRYGLEMRNLSSTRVQSRPILKMHRFFEIIFFIIIARINFILCRSLTQYFLALHKRKKINEITSFRLKINFVPLLDVICRRSIELVQHI